MKKNLIYPTFLLLLAGCDDLSSDAKTDIELQGGLRIPSSATMVKNYTAEKNSAERQHYIFDYQKPMNVVADELMQTLEGQGYSHRIKSKNAELIQFYFKKDNTSTVVANLKPSQEHNTRLSISWELEK